jgi:quinohemoprotein ethanol dehydrogenase
MENTCDLCHGVDAIQAGRDIPDLRASSADAFAMMREILDGAYRPSGMPAFKNINDEDVVALKAYLTEQAWNGYEKQKGMTHRQPIKPMVQPKR